MLTATGLKRSELGADGRKLVRHEGKQVLVVACEVASSRSPTAARTRAIR